MKIGEKIHLTSFQFDEWAVSTVHFVLFEIRKKQLKIKMNKKLTEMNKKEMTVNKKLVLKDSTSI